MVFSRMTRYMTVFVAGLVVSAATVSAQEKRPSDSVPAEAFFKNIQVFKGLPSSKLDSAMDFMAASLGVKCGFCHVISEGGPSTFWKDDKPEKRTARKMILMMRAINKDNFGGRQTVTCATCHAGHTMPAEMPPLPEKAALMPAHESESSSTPTLEAILEKYAGAVGSDAVAQIKSLEMKGTLTRANGKSYPITIAEAAPDKYSMTLTHPGGFFTQGANGTRGWMATARESEMMEPDDVAALESQTLFARTSGLKERYKVMAVTGTRMIDGQASNSVLGRTKSGAREELDFDARTGLLVRRVAYEETPLGSIPSETDYSDYRDVNGVKVPFSIRKRGGDSNDLQTFSEVRANAPIDPATFEVPAKK